jgi:hypothetical protein
MSSRSAPRASAVLYDNNNNNNNNIKYKYNKYNTTVTAATAAGATGRVDDGRSPGGRRGRSRLGRHGVVPCKCTKRSNKTRAAVVTRMIVPIHEYRIFVPGQWDEWNKRFRPS